MSATFGAGAGGAAKSPAPVAANGAQSEADQSKMSARMKRFTDGAGQGEAERIVAGKQEAVPTAAATASSADGANESKEDDLEVVI